MIIVEGADNVGKSTLISQLIALDPSLRVIHRDRFKPGQQETIGTTHLRALLPDDGDRFAHAHSLADRFFASEEIYGELFRKGSRFSPAERLAIRSLLASYDAMIVHCDPPYENVRLSWGEREQLYPDDPGLIWRKYRERIPEIFNGLHVVRYDWTKDSAPTERKRIVDLHTLLTRKARRPMTWWSALPGGCGQLDMPSVVIVHDFPPGLVGSRSIRFATLAGGDLIAHMVSDAERHLKRSLARDLYITGALRGTDRDASLLRHELTSLRLLPESLVIAMGSTAASMLTHVLPQLPETPRVATVPDPIFWQSFNHYARRDYFERFTNALHTKLNADLFQPSEATA